MSKAHLPPVPPDNRSPHGGSNADSGELNPKEAKEVARDRTSRPEQRGEQANIAQNTHNQGYQQDR